MWRSVRDPVPSRPEIGYRPELGWHPRRRVDVLATDSNGKLTPYLNNHIPRQAEVITRIVRISQQEPERTSH